MKKYRITDVDTTESFEIEQIGDEDEVVEPATDPAPAEEVTVHDEDALTAEEIAALRKLAAVADTLVAMCSGGSEETEVTDEDEVTEEVVEEPVEEVVETEDCDTKDSKRSFGSIARKSSTSDSAIVDEISLAWAKRYGGNK